MSKDIYPTLKKSGHEFSVSDYQVSILENRLKKSVKFKDKLKEISEGERTDFVLNCFKTGSYEYCKPLRIAKCIYWLPYYLNLENNEVKSKYVALKVLIENKGLLRKPKMNNGEFENVWKE